MLHSEQLKIGLGMSRMMVVTAECAATWPLPAPEGQRSLRLRGVRGFFENAAGVLSYRYDFF
ncbi:hypothetical protein I4X03_015480 [Massilia sp. R798]|uniref:Uncharacterized protein n=1 Tax=Massilia soli TaxID=2792854 RepID=A0ABS7SRV5_9BURK|nr:hypothetical protein [Massilia soli]